MTRFLFDTRCRTCGKALPTLGDGGHIGLPSACRLQGSEDDPVPFGAIYEGLAAANLMNETLDRHLETLKKHRNHKLEQRSRQSPDEDPYRTGPWKPASEARPSPDFGKGYVTAWYGATCQRCARAFVAQDRQKLRRFRPTALTATRIRKYFDAVAANLGADLDNPAAPLTPKELAKLGTFLTAHSPHGVRVALLRTAAERAAVVPRKGGRRSVPPKRRALRPIRTLDDWWARLEKSGWLAEVGPAEANRIGAAVDAHAADVSQAFHALSPAGFDAECIEEAGDYGRWVIPAYAKASSGAFQPTDVKERLDRRAETAVLSFQAGGRRFSREFAQDSDYVADGVHDFLNEALADLGERRRFHLLPTADQTAEIVCVTDAMYQRAILAGLIPERAAPGT